MNDSPISIRGLSKRYGSGAAVLDGLDLRVERGSVVGLLGRNGVGKSTLLKCAVGLLSSDFGEACVFGTPATELGADEKSRLGYVPQEIEFYPWMSVEETLDYTGAFYKTWNSHFAKETARNWGLDLSQATRKLSKGQGQMLAILLAIGHEPELLILDEPAASLDPAARRNFLGALVAMVSDLEQSVLFSTHITSDLERVADHVAILQSARIGFFGELDELKESVKRIRLVSKGALPRMLEVPEAISTHVRGNEALISLTNCNEALLARLEREHNAQVEVQDLSLEDIFLEMHHV
jgi:ABC-2 type transport system ATP-binding protein